MPGVQCCVDLRLVQRQLAATDAERGRPLTQERPARPLSGHIVARICRVLRYTVWGDGGIPGQVARRHGQADRCAPADRDRAAAIGLVSPAHVPLQQQRHGIKRFGQTPGRRVAVVFRITQHKIQRFAVAAEHVQIIHRVCLRVVQNRLRAAVLPGEPRNRGCRTLLHCDAARRPVGFYTHAVQQPPAIPRSRCQHRQQQQCAERVAAFLYLPAPARRGFARRLGCCLNGSGRRGLLYVFPLHVDVTRRHILFLSRRAPSKASAVPYVQYSRAFLRFPQDIS